jgi:hypothetical protein
MPIFQMYFIRQEKFFIEINSRDQPGRTITN